MPLHSPRSNTSIAGWKGSRPWTSGPEIWLAGLLFGFEGATWWSYSSELFENLDEYEQPG